MRYFVTVGERTFEVQVNGNTATIDGESVEASLTQAAGTAVRRLAVNSATHRLFADAAEGKGNWDLHLDGFRIAAEVVDERTRLIRAMTAKSGAASGPRPVKAPMPGMIVRLEVQPGDKVEAGQGVVVIEAMKMENELKAESAGTVSKIHATPGNAVEKGTVLIEFTNDG